MTEQQAAELLQVRLPVLGTELEYAYSREQDELDRQHSTGNLNDAAWQSGRTMLEQAYTRLQQSLNSPAAQGNLVDWSSAHSSPISSDHIKPGPTILPLAESRTASSQIGRLANTIANPVASLVQTLKARQAQLANSQRRQKKVVTFAAPRLLAPRPAKKTALKLQTLLVPDSVQPGVRDQLATLLRAMSLIVCLCLLGYWSFFLFSPPPAANASIQRKFIQTNARLRNQVVLVTPVGTVTTPVSPALYNNLNEEQQVRITYRRFNILVLAYPQTTILTINGQATAAPSHFEQIIQLFFPALFMLGLLFFLASRLSPRYQAIAHIIAQVPPPANLPLTPAIEYLVLQWPGPHRATIPIKRDKLAQYLVGKQLRIVYHYAWLKGHTKPLIAIDSFKLV